MTFCPNCGNQNSDGVKFCNNCGTSLQDQTTPSSQQEPQSMQQQNTGYTGPTQQGPVQYNAQQNMNQGEYYQQNTPNYQPIPNNTRYQQVGNPQQQMGFYGPTPDYIRPADYVFTETMSQRIAGTLKRDIHVVEEIEEREDLNQEALRLLLINFTLLTILKLFSILTYSNYYIVYSTIGTILEVAARIFIGGYLYIRIIASVGKSIGGQGTQTDAEEMQRVLSYAYVAYVIEGIFDILSDIYPSFLLLIVWVISLLYAFFVFIFAVRRALDKGFGTALVTVVISYIGKLIVEAIISIIFSFIFGYTYIYTG